MTYLAHLGAVISIVLGSFWGNVFGFYAHPIVALTHSSPQATSSYQWGPVGTLAGLGHQPGYYKDATDQQIYYLSINHIDPDHGILVTPQPDSATFVVFNTLNDWGQRPFAKDKNHVYIFGSELQDADAVTFHFIGSYAGVLYFEDNQNVYNSDSLIQYGLVPSDADQTTFTFLDEYIGYDLHTLYGKDKTHVWIWGGGPHVIAGADPATFALVRNSSGEATGYEKDAAHVYAGGELIAGADPATLDDLNSQYSTSGICGAPHYVKDSTHVYVLTIPGCNDSIPFSKVLSDADAATFVQISCPDDGVCIYDAQDKNHQYLNGKVVQ